MNIYDLKDFFNYMYVPIERDSRGGQLDKKYHIPFVKKCQLYTRYSMINRIADELAAVFHFEMTKQEKNISNIVQTGQF